MERPEACPHVPSCDLYPQFQFASNLAMWRERYCNGRFANCARFKLSEQGERPPAALLPNGTLLKKVK
jgi:hypothetical protein